MLNIALGQTINGQAVYADLADMPHLLIAGSDRVRKICLR